MKLKGRNDAFFVVLAFVSIVMMAHANSQVSTDEKVLSRGTLLQSMASQARRLELLADYLGQPLSEDEKELINRAFENPDPEWTIEQVGSVLDRHALITVTLGPKGLVDVARGEASADLIQNGWRMFFVKIENQTKSTARFRIVSPNGGPVFTSINESDPRPPVPGLSEADIRDRWAIISLLQVGPDEPELPNDLDIETRIQERVAAMNTPVPRVPDGLEVQEFPELEGSTIEYRAILIYSRDSGNRAGTLQFETGQSFQNVGEATVLFNIAASRKIRLNVFDYNGEPTTAGFVFEDNLDRIYPPPLKRSVPDFYFEPQVYRAHGDFISLPSGTFTVTFTGGPEYVTQTKTFVVDSGGPRELTFHLERWINPAKYGWYSGDDHVHQSGCAHYPELSPKDMEPQISGEHLDVTSILNWRPDYYYQRRFFDGRKDNDLSKPGALLHYGLEISGFPSSHSGHLILLDLDNQDYPGAKRIEDWPSWNLPIIRWAKSQGGTVGFAHSGGGFALGSTELPNYEIPLFDAPGALEFVVDVTFDHSVDFLEIGNGPFPYDLNLWYQTLNVGFRASIVGGTDFPCIYDARVGMVRTYSKIEEGNLTYSGWLSAVRRGASYVSDGRSHLMDFAVDGIEVGKQESEVTLPGPRSVIVKAKAAAYLDPFPNAMIQNAPFDIEPYWDTERARLGNTRKVAVELVMNGEVFGRKPIIADGSVQDVNFTVPVARSGWMALRIVPSAHTNAIFVLVGGKPISPSLRSAKWCLASVDQSWDQQSPGISVNELPDAQKAYDHARQIYRGMVGTEGR